MHAYATRQSAQRMEILSQNMFFLDRRLIPNNMNRPAGLVSHADSRNVVRVSPVTADAKRLQPE
jgi:hypothetical protein